MKRITYRAILKNDDGVIVETTTAYAWNSAKRRGEALAIEYGRTIGAKTFEKEAIWIDGPEPNPQPNGEGCIGRTFGRFDTGERFTLEWGRAFDFIEYLPTPR